jgi:hypothetical protein
VALDHGTPGPSIKGGRRRLDALVDQVSQERDVRPRIHVDHAIRGVAAPGNAQFCRRQGQSEAAPPSRAAPSPAALAQWSPGARLWTRSISC